MKISDNDKAWLLSLTPEDLTWEMFVSIFANKCSNTGKLGKTGVAKSRFEPTDTFDLLPGEYFVKEKTTTTVGKFIYNKYIIEGAGLKDAIGYVNDEMTSKNIKKLETKLAEALLDGKITAKECSKYIDRRELLGQQLHSIICPSFNVDIVKTLPSVENEKKRLLKENKKAVDEGNIQVISDIEKSLINKAKSALSDNPSIDLYNSGARGSFENNYKNMNIMKGPVYNTAKGKYDLVEDCFTGGYGKEQIPSLANATVASQYPKSVGTQESGYGLKKLVAMTQSVVADKKGSDCGSKATIPVLLTSANASDFKYRYIVEKGKLVLLEPSVLQNYIGQVVHLRSPMTCVGERLCNACIGELFYKLGIENIGITTSAIAGTMSNMNMKKMHVTAVNVHTIDLNKYCD